MQITDCGSFACCENVLRKHWVSESLRAFKSLSCYGLSLLWDPDLQDLGRFLFLWSIVGHCFYHSFLSEALPL